MTSKKVFAIFMVLALISGVLYGLQNSWFKGGLTNNQVSASELTQSLKNKYGDTESVVYSKPLNDLAADQVIVFDVEFDPLEAGFEYDELNQIIDVFLDPELTVSANPQIDFNSETNEITVAPPSAPVFGLDDRQYEEDNQNWGYAGKYYAVKFYNSKGNKLTKPNVTIFTIKNKLAAPDIEFYKQDGFAALKWNAVEGADEYRIYKISKYISETDGQYNYLKQELSQTTDNNFIYDWVEGERAFTAMNALLADATESPYYLAVIAVNDSGSSQISNPIYSKDVAPILPYRLSFDNDDPEFSTLADHVDELGVYRLMEMCDGNKIPMRITYDIEQTRVVNLQDEVNFDYEEYALLIPYTVNDTIFGSISLVMEYDYPELEQDLQKLKQREQSSKSKAGRISTTINLTPDTEEPEEETPQEKETKVTADGYNVFATNALSEYLAIHMLNGSQKISLDEFSESYDKEYLVDAWQEAVYQNPLILGVPDIKIGKNNNLTIKYDETREEQQRKQKEIDKEVERVISKIIKKNMTDLEKELAINDYICETAEYDSDALKNAEKNGFKFVDPEYYDSFTPYGVLINKTGVCSSYSAAFKLLADEAGLESIVVTGYLNGNLPHAWNRVLIDGEWMTVDSTNNDNDELFNVFFNLPDNVAGTILIEDDRYIINSILGSYTASGDESEYYHVKGLYYSQKEIVDMFVADLQRNGSATLRTDYTLTDKQLNTIIQNVEKNGNYNSKSLNGSHWLGTIHLTLK